jgi:hypothetical protein
MSYFDNTYKFLLDGVQVYPLIPNEFKLDWEKEEGSYYFRRKLNSDIKLTGSTYNGIYESSISVKFNLVIQKKVSDLWEDFYTGFFYKTDCKFDHDYKILTVKPTAADGWGDIQKVLNNEYNIAAAAVPNTPFLYKIRPILQIIWPVQVDDGAGGVLDLGYNRITNVVGTAVYDEVLEADVVPANLASYGFRENTINVVMKVYTRYLHNNAGLSPSAARLTNDISKTAPYFKYTSDIDVSSYISIGNYQTPSPTDLGKVRHVYATSLLCTPGTYYLDVQTLNTDLVRPVVRESWSCFSAWWRVSTTLYGIEMNVIALTGHEFTVSAYRIHDVLQYLLEQETDILHSNTADYSEFLYNGPDPIGEEDYELFFAPKSNVVNAFYTKAARKAPVKLIDILEMLKSAFRLYWHIEKNDTGEDILRLEHISWYENGGIYGDQSVSLDMISSIDKRTGKSLSFRQNKFTYLKANMPQRYEFTWDRDASKYFTGNPIVVIDEYVEDGVVIKEDNGQFMPDFDTTIANIETSLDGFMFVNCELDGSDYVIKSDNIQVTPTQSLPVQNGSLSYVNLHPLYHRYGLPALNVSINEEQTTALSIIRNKQQGVNFAYQNVEIDPLKLITTELGSGQIDKMSLNLVSNKFEITLNHDTE